MSEPWVVVGSDAITSRWRPLTADEAAIVDQMIADAQDDLEDALTKQLGITGPPVPEDPRWERRYTRTVAGMVQRVLNNPEGYLEEEADGYRYRYDKAVSSGALYIGDDELERFRPGRRRRAFSIRTT